MHPIQETDIKLLRSTGNSVAGQFAPQGHLLFSFDTRNCPAGAQPLCVSDARSVKPIGRTTINRRRAESPDRRKILDAQACIDQVVGNMEHDDFADKQGVRAQWLRAKELAFQAHLRLRYTRRLDVNAGRGMQVCRSSAPPCWSRQWSRS